jgi:hypothetical protein
MDNGSVQLPGTVTDISLGGCYVEMLAPLPVDTTVELLLNPEDTTMRMSGKVRSSQTGLGMGIAFTGMRPADFEKLQRLAPAPAKTAMAQKPPEAKPAAQRAATLTNASAPRAQTRPPATRALDAGVPPATPEAFQAVVRLLFRKGLLTHAELMEELEKLKPTRA